MSWWSRKVIHSKTVMSILAWTLVVVLIILLIVATIMTWGALSGAWAFVAEGIAVTASYGLEMSVGTAVWLFISKFCSIMMSMLLEHWVLSLLFVALVTGSSIGAVYATEQYYDVKYSLMLAQAEDLNRELSSAIVPSPRFLSPGDDSQLRTNWPLSVALALQLTGGTSFSIPATYPKVRTI